MAASASVHLRTAVRVHPRSATKTRPRLPGRERERERERGGGEHGDKSMRYRVGPMARWKAHEIAGFKVLMRIRQARLTDAAYQARYRPPRDLALDDIRLPSSSLGPSERSQCGPTCPCPLASRILGEPSATSFLALKLFLVTRFPAGSGKLNIA